MISRMTNEAALELLETVFNSGAETIGTGIIEGYVYGIDVAEARADVESFLSTLDEGPDPDSIEIHSDYSDEADMAGVRIVIKTEA